MEEVKKIADRMAFLAALVISETEEVMKFEAALPGGVMRKRHRALEKSHRAAFGIFDAYDKNLDRGDIYEKASRCIDAINSELEKSA